MTLTSTTLDSRYATKIIQDTDADNTVVVDITGGTGSVYYVQLVSGSTSQTNYFEIFDTGEVTLGTTEPVFKLKIPASTTVECIITSGLAYSSALSFAATQVNGTSSPTGSTITARIVAS